VIGTANVLTTAVVTLARNGTIQPPAAAVASLAGSTVIDLVVVVTAFRVLTAATVRVRRVPRGALLVTISWLGLQTLGGLYVEHVVADANETYGVFAVVIGLLSWLWLAAQLTPALRKAAVAGQHDPRQHIVVSFDPDADPLPDP